MEAKMTVTHGLRTLLASGLFLVLTTPCVTAQTFLTFGDIIEDEVRAVIADGAEVYVGGDFESIATDVTLSRVAKWSGQGLTLDPVGRGVDDRIYDLAVLDGNLYVTGRVTEAFNADGTSVDVNGVAMWDGTTWHALGSGLAGPERTLGYALAVLDGKVYVGGEFTEAGGIAVNNMAGWDPDAASWFALGDGLTDVVRSLAADPVAGVVYAAGDFEAGGDGAAYDYIAYWDGAGWNGMGDGLADTGRTIMLTERYVYACGGGDVPVLARWDGTIWEDMSTGFDDRIYAVAVVSDDWLIVSGDFTRAGDADASRLTRFDGTGWSAVGSGLDGKAWDMKVHGGNILIGGEFEVVNGRNSRYFAVLTGVPVAAGDASIPRTIALHPNYPNPFNPGTMISFEIDHAAPVALRVFDVLGREVARPVDGMLPAGHHEIRFDGALLPSGLYACVLSANGTSVTRTMMLAK